ncbi:MAG: hypothetical protein JSW08_02725 [archaeon]|nr:MAG: hypothetical protein JSW08_02725 [archaeon]
MAKTTKGNLIVSFDPVHEEAAKAEILGILKESKNTGKLVGVSEGLAEVSVTNPRKAIKGLLVLAKKNINKFRYTFNWWPVDKWCKSDISDMQKVIKVLQKKIKDNEAWKLDLIKRKLIKNYGSELIVRLTDVVDKKNVNLNKPQKILRVEIDGERAAISLLAPEDLLNVPGLKK